MVLQIIRYLRHSAVGQVARCRTGYQPIRCQRPGGQTGRGQRANSESHFITLLYIAALDRFETTTSRLLAEHLPHSSVVKAFNAILAQDLVQDARPKAAPDRRALPIAADDPAAKALVIKLLDEIGFDAVDAGSLDESWRFERAKPAYCIPLDKEGLKVALAAAHRQVELPEGSWRR